MQANRALLLTRLSERLHVMFGDHINLSDVASKPKKDQESFFLTRSLAALSLMDDADLSVDQAAKCVTDGGADDGIDAIRVDEKKKILYFVQSKWRSSSKGVELSDFTRFRDGVKKVINLHWDKDNANLHPFRPKIEIALNDIETSFVMIFAHTAETNIAENIRNKIKEFLTEQNKVQSDFLEFREIDFSKITHIARSKTRESDIHVSIMLGHWGRQLQPYDAVYGSVSAVDIAKWYEDNGTKLFAENLRYVIEKSEVNERLIETATNEPSSFWYFNNGITAICESFKKQPHGGSQTESGVFEVRKMSIINGAQTIGSLARAKAGGVNIDHVRAHLRIISLANTPEGFSSSVTRSNNTQNDLNAADFVAFDPNQDRLRREAEQIGVTYAFRRGEADPQPKSGFNIRSATVALACASGDLKLAVSAKRYISGLWEDIKKEPYTKLFNDKTNALYLWRVVQLMNSVDTCLAAEADKLEGRDRLIAIHGNRFILFYVFSQIDHEKLKDATVQFDPFKKKCSELATACLAKIIPIINSKFPDSYPGNIFKNQDRQVDLLAQM